MIYLVHFLIYVHLVQRLNRANNHQKTFYSRNVHQYYYKLKVYNIGTLMKVYIMILFILEK